jgi:hypothetical protein
MSLAALSDGRVNVFMMRMVVLMCLLTACPGPAAPGLGRCRNSGEPASCFGIPEIGSPQGPFLEGAGLERLHFRITAGAFPPATGTTLSAVAVCGNAHPLHLRVKRCGPVLDAEVDGAFGCRVDVVNPGITSAVTDICSKPALTVVAPDPGRSRGVIAVRGYWDAGGAWRDDPELITLACDARGSAPGTQQFEQADGAITKCVRDWRLDPAHLGDAFQACIRMARADYCGDGQPHTKSSTLVAASTPLDPMTTASCMDGRCFEASWSKDGAVCFARPRWSGPGMGIEACAGDFHAVDDMQCRGDPAQALVFSRSQQNVCGRPAPQACRRDSDPVCTAL